MMKRLVYWGLLCLFLCPITAQTKEIYSYKDVRQPIEKRVTDLLSRMTLEEKVAQMCQFVGIEHIKETERKFNGRVSKNDDANGFYKNLSITDLIHLTEKGFVGSFLHVVTPEEANYLQSLAQKSRLQIPLLIGIDAIHGDALCSGATVYPTPIGQASTFDTLLVRKASRETAEEMRASGSHWTFTPNIDVSRDARWGRVGETFGEDPYLVSRMGVATILGFQGNDFNGNDKVLACAKHLIAGSEPANGTNASPMDVSEFTLRDVFLPSYKAAIQEAGVFSVMAAHNELNGIPCHANKWMMTDIIRTEMGFKGFIVSDWMDIERIFDLHHYTASLNDAYLESVQAGMDMHMHGPDFAEAVIELVKEGKLPEARVNEACSKILEAKFRLGLFENAFIDIDKARSTFYSQNHLATALEMAEKSIVLLKNDNLLPIDFTNYKNILVTGPNANSAAVLGDWALKQPDNKVVTVLKGLQQLIPAEKLTFYDCGTDVRSTDSTKVFEAETLARKADLAIVVVGENPLRYEKTKSTGENVDRMSLDLLGIQDLLVQKIQETGVPTIVVLVGGRPLSINRIAQKVPAIIQAWEPGSLAGTALANIISGKVNPSAKLPVSIPRSAGQIQQIYNHKPSQYFHNYKDDLGTPLYSFGFGLSYTTFSYDSLKLEKQSISSSENVKVSVRITNTGKVTGTEIAQLYIHDEVSQPTRPVKELKDFASVELKPAESKVVTFTITPDKLAFHNLKMQSVVEPGKFEIMVGKSSQDEDLLKTTLIVN